MKTIKEPLTYAKDKILEATAALRGSQLTIEQYEEFKDLLKRFHDNILVPGSIMARKKQKEENNG